MIEKTIENWHQHIRGRFAGGLDELIAEDCVFYSPIVFTPQRGKELTKLYLDAATSTFGGEPGGESSGGESKFHYTKQTFAGNHAILEFETEMAGKYVNGVDIISCNDEGKIVEFKVMIRPLQAVNLLHERMAAMLKKMQGGD